MRRTLSIFLILNFWLGPLAAILPAGDESRLPPCCRRHGAHHCAMAMRMASMLAQAASGKTAFTAPATCPSYPGYPAILPSTIPALAATTVSLPVLLAQPHWPAAGRAATRLSQIRTRASRGPPSIIPA
jgi:hypothetical protein